MTLHRPRILLFLSLLIAACAATTLAQNAPTVCSQCADWNQAQKPFRIFSNTYYVGPHGLSSILITSDEGHILIDGGLPESARQIEDNIRSLGFRVEDVKVILNSHVHFDHAGGIAQLQQWSGARVLASHWSAAVMRNGGVGRGDPQYGTIQGITPVANVHDLEDGETVRVGPIAIMEHSTPGHTPGGSSWTWTSCEGKLCYAVVFADSLAPISAEGFEFADGRNHPHALEDFEKSFSFLETTPCDILITPHPEASDLWSRLEARERGVRPDPMVDAGACRQLAERGREQLKDRIAKERSTGPKSK